MVSALDSRSSGPGSGPGCFSRLPCESLIIHFQSESLVRKLQGKPFQSDAPL